jgi:hypothetical protein
MIQAILGVNLQTGTKLLDAPHIAEDLNCPPLLQEPQF